MDFSERGLTEALGNAEGIDMTTSNASGIFVIRPLKGEGRRNEQDCQYLPAGYVRCHVAGDGDRIPRNLMTWCMSPPLISAGTV